MNQKFSPMLFAIIFAFSALFSFAQISKTGTPKSVSSQEKSILKSVKYKSMPTVNIAALKIEDDINDQRKDRPWRFGQNIEVSLTPENSGSWDTLSNGSKIWRLGINSPGALSLNLTFDRFVMPEGAEMYIYSEDMQHMLGAFTDANNREDGLFATTLLLTDKLIIEYNEPAKTLTKRDISISTVTHGYRGIKNFEKSLGSSGSCNVNVACPEGANWEDQINSVAMMVTGGNGFCSGALINNTNNDETPYFLSANHCYENPATVVYWFNWQSDICSNPSSSPSYNSISGASDISKNAESDFWLVELSSAPTEDYNPYYAGWNRSTANSLTENVVGVHHPSGDIKKISWSAAGVTQTDYSSTSGTSHWRVTSWDDGTTTEGGSSGSPLFDSEGRIIGQLHGGGAACGNTDSDWYGCLGTSWTGGGSEATSLSSWLDPLGTGVTTLEGYDPYAITYTIDAQIYSIISPEVRYDNFGTVTPSIVIRNRGTENLTSATISYAIDGNLISTLNWTGNLAITETETVELTGFELTEGNHTFSATITVANDENPANDSKAQNFVVFDCTSPATLPFSEDFEDGIIPGCWSMEYDNNNLNWIIQSGGVDSEPNGAASGNNNACLSHMDYDAQQTKLVTPMLNLSGMSNIELSFWHAQVDWDGDLDELKVYYKNSTEGNWVLLQSYTTEVANWTEHTISLPNPSSEYYVAFEGTAQYGFGVCIDNILIDGEITCTGPGTQSEFSLATPTANSIELTWSSGDGDASLIVAREESSVNSLPSNGVSYTDNAEFGLGTELGSVNFVVYNGTANTATITGLNQATNYVFSVYEYYVSDNCYNLEADIITATTSSTPMEFVSITAEQASTQPIFITDSYDAVIRIPVVTAGAGTPLTLNSLTFNTNGTTNRIGDIMNVKVHYTGTSPEYSTSNQVGATIGYPDETFTIDSEVELSDGTNYFWLSVLLKSSATAGNFIDAELSSATINNIDRIPDVQAPEGNREISSNPCLIANFPYNEDFEEGIIPECWTMEYDNNNLDWLVQSGGIESYPSGAASGNYNACLFFDAYNARQTKLITPMLDLNNRINVELSFWHAQVDWQGDLDELRVYYKNSIDGNWVLLQSYTNEVANWTEHTISLPNPSSEYFVAFEGTAQYGFGVCVDNITIDGQVACTAPSVLASDISENTTTATIALNWTPGDGNEALVIAREGEAVDFIPTDGETYIANSDLSTASDIQNGNYIIYNGNTNIVEVTGLNSNTEYHFAIFEIDNTTNCYSEAAATIAVTTLPNSMEFVSANTNQTNTDMINPGSLSQEVIGISIETINPDEPINISSFTFTSFGSTSASTDITNATLYYTGTSDSFDISNQIGSSIDVAAELFEITTDVNLEEGTNYFWLAYDIATDATAGNIIDAECVSFTINSTDTQYPTTQSPEGSREISEDPCIVNSFPFEEGFEGGTLPACWTTEFITETQDWTIRTGASSNPTSAHTGTYNACLQYNNSSGATTMLVTPPIDFSGMDNAVLSFWHTQVYWTPDQDELRIYYKTSASTEWILLAEYTENVSTWTQRTIALENLSSDYYIGFEGTAQYGRGVCIDDIIIDGESTCIAPDISSSNITISTDITTAQLSWTQGNGNEVIILAKEGAAINATPTSGQSYSASTEFGLGDELGDSNFVVYAGSETSIEITGFTANTEYHFAIFDVNTNDMCYSQEEAIANAITLPTPMVHESTNITTTSSASIIPGDTEQQMLQIEIVTSGSASPIDAEGLSLLLDASTDFANDIESIAIYYTGNSDVFSSVNQTFETSAITSDSFDIAFLQTLSEGSNYFWIAFDIDANATPGNIVAAQCSSLSINGLSDDLSGSPVASRTIDCLYPTETATAFGSTSDLSSISVNWINNTGSNVIVIASENEFMNPVLTDGISYTANSGFGLGDEIGSGNFVVYTGTDNSVEVADLSEGTNYYFEIYTFNINGNCYNTTPLIGAEQTQSSAMEYVSSIAIASPFTNTTHGEEDFVVLQVAIETIGSGSNLTLENLSVSTAGSTNASSDISEISVYNTGLSNIFNANNLVGTTTVVNNENEIATSTELLSGTNYFWITLDISESATVDNLLTTECVSITIDGITYPLTSSEASENITIECETPAIAFAPINITSNTNSMELNWERGSGDGVVIIARSGNNTSVLPISGNNYPASTIFGDGMSLGDGNYIVYNGNANSSTITGLEPNTQYAFTLFEYNSSGYCYSTGALAAAEYTIPTAPELIIGTQEVCEGSIQAYSVSGTEQLEYNWEIPTGWALNSGQTTNTINVTVGSSDGVISVTAGNTAGSSIPQTIEVNSLQLPLPATEITVADANICEGASTELTVTGGEGTTFAWYTDDVNGTIINSGTTLTVSPIEDTTLYYGRWENACGESEFQSVIVTTTERPNAPEIRRSRNRLISNTATGINWYFDSQLIIGATDSIYTVSEEGEYYATTSDNGCISIPSNTLEIIFSTDISDTDNGEFAIYPNPFSEYATVLFEGEFNIIISNELGQIVYSGYSTNSIEINSTSFQTGIYSVKVWNSEKTESAVIIKE